ncbi:hypothetical protein EUX98_g3364 [Antrodiella citrinella]|uniref:Protein kinase domain-containing protein n=1 Tax=Antrodiella citrinella TaxID=2447956 RepID=A0A4S4MWQ9_9APHY|nr:hypothetical protein EUX98_g3364 [Antrodiella citrinella]
MSSMTPKNQHRDFSVGPNGESVYDLSFASEPLGMPASAGHGWAQLDFGQKIGPQDRFTVERKLGWGMHSSTWLARDTLDRRFVAIKVLTGYMTDTDRKNLVWESDALHAVSHLPLSAHSIRVLEDHFTIPGKDLSGDHLCFVTPVYGGDVERLWRANHKKFPLSLTKRILLHLLRGVAHAHDRGVVHADLKKDNIFYDTLLTTSQIDQILVTDPPRRHDPEISHEGTIIQSAVSQPLPIISLDEAQSANFLLADFGCAQPSTLHDRRLMNILPYRPPEVWMDGEWDTPADIWAFGWKDLFQWEVNEEWGLTKEQNMFYQMMCRTGDNFVGPILSQWPSAIQYFNTDCTFKAEKGREIVLQDETFEVCIKFDTRDKLDLWPELRASAEDLLTDPWFSDVVA